MIRKQKIMTYVTAKMRVLLRRAMNWVLKAVTGPIGCRSRERGAAHSEAQGNREGSRE